jgi:hypothetical protein
LGCAGRFFYRQTRNQKRLSALERYFTFDDAMVRLAFNVGRDSTSQKISLRLDEISDEMLGNRG